MRLPCRRVPCRASCLPMKNAIALLEHLLARLAILLGTGGISLRVPEDGAEFTHLRNLPGIAISEPTQPLQQLAVDAAEPAVAEYDHDFSPLRALRDMGHDGVHVGQVGGVFAQRF